ncbi:MAG: hypothetical protein ACI86H_002123 [bacterium]|jgi:hypothetical protein
MILFLFHFQAQQQTKSLNQFKIFLQSRQPNALTLCIIKNFKS